MGFGGAFTDSTGINILALNETGDAIYRSYFADNGLQYNLCRVPMGGTDFSTFGYSYLDYPGVSNVNEKNYSLVEEDYKYKIPLIKNAKSLSPDLLLFTSTWAAPKLWKTNGVYEGPGELKVEFYQAWADYFLRFLDLYKNESIDFWGITTGNEAFSGLLTFIVNSKIPTVAWSPLDMKTWIVENLGPTLRNSDSHKDINILTLDDQRFLLPFFENIFTDGESSKFINGVGTHWYWDEFSPTSLLEAFHQLHPDKFILATEACTGAALYDYHGIVLGSWGRGERYAVSIIENLQNWAVGWVDWNMALNEAGGPTYIDNFVDSPIVVNATAQEFYKQPMFYAMGHFSKFLPRGSIRIGLVHTYLGLKMLAFKRPDSILVLVIVNTQPFDTHIKIFVPNKGMIDIVIDQHSFTSFVI